MNILRNGLKAGSIGFVVAGLLELIGALPALYCLKGILQPFVWLCIGWLAGLFIIRNEASQKWSFVIPTSLLAGLITGAGSILSQMGMQAYLTNISMMPPGDMMFPAGMDPISEKWWRITLVAIILSAVGGSISIIITKCIKPKTITANAIVIKKHRFAWIGFLLGALIGGLILTGVVTLLYNTLSSHPSGNISGWARSDFINFMWPYTLITGMLTGTLAYAGIYLLRTSSTTSHRNLSFLLMAIGIIVWITVCFALSLFIITLDMM